MEMKIFGLQTSSQLMYNNFPLKYYFLAIFKRHTVPVFSLFVYMTETGFCKLSENNEALFWYKYLKSSHRHEGRLLMNNYCGLIVWLKFCLRVQTQMNTIISSTLSLHLNKFCWYRLIWLSPFKAGKRHNYFFSL